MATETYFSPGLTDVGPEPGLQEAASLVANSLVGHRAYRAQRTSVSVKAQEPPFVVEGDPELSDNVEHLVQAVHRNFKLTSFIIVERHWEDTHTDWARPWHTDTNTVGGVRIGDTWQYPVNPSPRPAYLMSIGGPSTEGIDGEITIDADKKYPFDLLELRLDDPSVPPSDQMVSDGLHAFYQGKYGVITGTQSQLVQWKDDIELNPAGDYRITSFPEGHVGELHPLTVHKPPSFVPAGRTLLYMV